MALLFFLSYLLHLAFAFPPRIVMGNGAEEDPLGTNIKSTQSNADTIFNAIHSAGRQWGSSVNHNGVSIFPATVPFRSSGLRSRSSMLKCVPSNVVCSRPLKPWPLGPKFWIGGSKRTPGIGFRAISISTGPLDGMSAAKCLWVYGLAECAGQ